MDSLRVVMNQGAIEIARRQFRQQRWKLGTHWDQASVTKSRPEMGIQWG